MLLRNTLYQNKSYGHSWLASCKYDIPAGLIRHIQVSLYIEDTVYVDYVSCSLGVLTLSLSCSKGQVAYITTNKSMSFVQMDSDADFVAGAWLFTGTLDSDFEVKDTDNSLVLSCGSVVCVAVTELSPVTAMEVNGVKTASNTDIELVVDTNYYDYSIEDNTLIITVTDAAYRSLMPEPTAIIDITNPLYTINGVQPDSEGNINISVVNAETGAIIQPVYDRGVFYIDANTTFATACNKTVKDDPLTYDNDPSRIRTYKKYPLDCMFGDDGVRNMDLLEELKYELPSTGGIGLYDVNTLHDHVDNVMDVCI